MLLTKDSDPILLRGPDSDECALLSGQVRDVRVLREFTHPDEDYPFSRIESLADVVAGIAGDARSPLRVGLVGRLPPRGVFYLALPIKVEGQSGSPSRAIAFAPEEGAE